MTSPRRGRFPGLVTALVGLLAITGVAVATPSAAAPTPERPGASSAKPGLGEFWIRHTMRRMTLEQKVGQLFVADVWGLAADEAHPTNQTKYGVDTPAEVVRRYHPGGVIYFNNSGTDNIESPRQVAGLSNGLQRASLLSGAHVPLIISIDQEGGRVTRLGTPATEYPSAMALGAARDEAGARELAAISARELRALGINQNFAPDADVNSNPLNPIIGSRSFSSDPTLASRFVTAQIQGYQDGRLSESVSTSAKHFPGHGDAATDSHTGLPTIGRSEADWRRIDRPTFQAAVDAGADSIMTAHIAVPSLDPSGLPATLSKPIMTGLLREELGYDGVVVTDSLQMQGVRDLYPDSEVPVVALEAGVDQMLMPPDLDAAVTGVLDAVRSGRITEQRIDVSVRRILAQKVERGILTRPFVDERRAAERVGTQANLAAVSRVTDGAPTVLRNEGGVLPLASDQRVLVTGWNRADYPGYPAEPVRDLAAALESTELRATALSTGARPTQATIDRAVAAAREVDTVVVITNGLRTDTAQRALVNALIATGKPVVAVSVQEPYDPGFATPTAWVATYDWRGVSMTSLARVLSGAVAPRGTLPVDVPAPDGAVRYPLGHGLSW